MDESYGTIDQLQGFLQPLDCLDRRELELNNHCSVFKSVTRLQVLPVVYLLGFTLLRKQLQRERQFPPPYSPPFVESTLQTPGGGLRALLELGPADDGTHDVYSESPAESTSDTAYGIEMREVERAAPPVFLASSRSR